VPRNGNAFRSFLALNEAIPNELHAQSAVLDGEIVCLDRHGKPQSFVGREFDAALANELPSETDPCGERGEFPQG
jgi:diphthamide synthase (EF-2-diphthine--ammonia ligase)